MLQIVLRKVSTFIIARSAVYEHFNRNEPGQTFSQKFYRLTWSVAYDDDGDKIVSHRLSFGCEGDDLDDTDNEECHYDDTAHYELVIYPDELGTAFAGHCVCVPDDPYPNPASVNGQLNTILHTRRGTSLEFQMPWNGCDLSLPGKAMWLESSIADIQGNYTSYFDDHRFSWVLEQTPVALVAHKNYLLVHKAQSNNLCAWQFPPPYYGPVIFHCQAIKCTRSPAAAPLFRMERLKDYNHVIPDILIQDMVQEVVEALLYRTTKTVEDELVRGMIDCRKRAAEKQRKDDAIRIRLA
jgi:hypothetical protein